MGVGVQRYTPAALLPGKTRYPLYRLTGPQGRSGRVRKISPQPVFDPGTSIPVASRYTDWAIPAHTSYTPTNINYYDLTPLEILSHYFVFVWAT
jgi:hypothetical protein